MIKLHRLLPAGQRGEPRMVLRVVADHHAGTRQARGHPRVGAHLASYLKERRPGAESLEHGEDPRRERAGPIVEGQRDVRVPA